MGTFSKQTNGTNTELEEGELENDENILYYQKERKLQKLPVVSPVINYDSEDDSEDEGLIKKCKTLDSTASKLDSNNDEFQKAAQKFQANKAKVNKVWNNVMMDDDIAADISGVFVQKEDNRHVENYPRPAASKKTENRKRQWPQKKKKFFPKKDTNVIIIEPIENPDNYTDEELAREIASRLSENNVEGIEKTVRMAGRDMALELLQQTIEMESLGGMKTQNNMRRRTPGGSYFHLLRCESRIPKKIAKKIVYAPKDDAAKERLKQKRKERNRKKREEKKRAIAAKNPSDKESNKMDATAESKLPDLPTILEVYAKEKDCSICPDNNDGGGDDDDDELYIDATYQDDL